MSAPDTSAVRCTAYASGACSVVATGLACFLIVLAVTTDVHGCDMVQFTHLNATCLRDNFARERENRFYDFTFDIADAMANLLAIPPVLMLAHLYRHSGSAAKLMVPAFAAGVGITAVQLVNRAGTHTAVDWMSGPDWNLDDDQVRVLAISTFITRSQSIWMFALDFLLEAIGMLCAANLVYSSDKVISRWWAHLGVFGAFLGLLSFFMEIGRFGSWQLMDEVAGITMALLGFVIQPIWVVWLGASLDSAAARAYMPTHRMAERDSRDGAAVVELAGDRM